MRIQELEQAATILRAQTRAVPSIRFFEYSLHLRKI